MHCLALQDADDGIRTLMRHAVGSAPDRLLPAVKPGETYDLGRAFMFDYSVADNHGDWGALLWINKPEWAD